MRLFAYFDGENSSHRKIKMTVPVLVSVDRRGDGEVAELAPSIQPSHIGRPIMPAQLRPAEPSARWSLTICQSNVTSNRTA